jgi:conjugative transfer region protein (TIGR03750 family)
MLLNNINQKMPIYKDCTLGEVMMTAITSLLVLVLFFSLLSRVIFGYFWPGYLLASGLFFFVTKLLLSILQKLKYGKPYGYYQHLTIKKLSEFGLIKNKFLIRHGRWSVRRFKHESSR